MVQWCIYARNTTFPSKPCECLYQGWTKSVQFPSPRSPQQGKREGIRQAGCRSVGRICSDCVEAKSYRTNQKCRVLPVLYLAAFYLPGGEEGKKVQK